jgi:hypothetical protein
MPNAWVQSVKLVTTSGHAPTSAQTSAFIREYCLPIAHPAQPAWRSPTGVWKPQRLDQLPNSSRTPFPGSGQLPAAQPVLDPSMERTGDLHRVGRRRKHRLLLVDHPTSMLIRRANSRRRGR